MSQDETDSETGKPDSYDDQGKVDFETALRPVTVRQMLEARRDHSAANLAIDGNDVVHVTVVANVISVNSSDATRYDFELEDGTRGRILGRKWCSENPADDVDMSAIVPCVYVRITGTLDDYKGRNYLEISKMRKVVDYHELYFHLLDTIVTTLTYERGPPPRNIFSSQSSISDSDGEARYATEQSTPEIQLDVFDSTFAMQAMHDSLPASPEPVAFSALPSLSLSRSTSDATNDRTRIQPKQPDSDHDMNNEISGSPDEDVSSPTLLKRDKGKGRATPIVNGYDQKSMLLQLTPTVGTPQSSSSSKSQSNSQFYKQSSPEPTIAYSNHRAVSAATGAPSLLPSSALPSFLDTSMTFTERKFDPYSDVSVLGRRILLVMLELEQAPPIYPMAEAVDTRYQGVDVGIIMTRMHSLDSSLTATDVDNEITFLLSEGYIYTTVDDCHVRITQTH